MDGLTVGSDSNSKPKFFNGEAHVDRVSQIADHLQEDATPQLKTAVPASGRENSEEKVAEKAEAKFPHNVWIQFGGVSHHFDRDQNFNENNFGIGVEYEFNKDLSVAVGQYRNSIRNTSHYAALAYTPLHAGPFSFGVAAGAIDGYYFNDGGIFPMAMPMATYETKYFGVNALYVPKVKDVSSVVGVQFKVRF